MVLIHTPAAPANTAAVGLPRYRQIANSLRDRIQRREWAAGDRLPGEETLAVQFGVSKLTMRQALGVLLNEGLIRREHGKGTFVTDLWQPSSVLAYTTRMEEIAAGSTQSSVTVLDRETVGGPWSDFESLELSPDSRVLRVRRVHSVDDRPRAYVVSYLPADLAERLEADDFEVVPFLLGVERRTGLRFVSARQAISASLADDETAQHLAIPLGSPVLLVSRTYFLKDGRPGYVALFRYPGAQFRFEVKLDRATVADDVNRWATPDAVGDGGVL